MTKFLIKDIFSTKHMYRQKRSKQDMTFHCIFKNLNTNVKTQLLNV